MNEQARGTLASHTTCQEAERAGVRLSDQGLPVERVAVIGQDVSLVEQVTGRMGHGGAALHGAGRPARRH
ncbi:general stress protein [Streptomyces sp. NPDC087263]|uniref:general stress protein n=1 Tax=Streptomyces sp. NPDC087263 TaxID=3365773 RepID=UPI0038027DE8